MFKFLAWRNPANEKSSAPVTPAQLSLPGCARAIATRSAKLATFKDAGIEMVIRVLETRAIGRRSAALYGRLSCRYGWAVNDEVGEARSTWSSRAARNE